ncbi:DUF2282 domain-containing protein [Thalassomonas sp. RHCl1]|uniref:BufA1 family periplasmic bufferin-type metallophore n=1 Tax=Thalassomonas sp. RHCl1 TaxID=2995320 RepID=UPI00248D0B41|nr:DUF2282 domain-containing protein [Thalassomonas sp. RHCl1]
MSHKLAISTALAATLALGVLSDAEAAERRAKKEKCYGISPAGQNDCSNLAGTHSCAGQSTVDNDPGEWRLVTKGLCKSQGGYTRKEAREIIKQLKKAK